MKTSLETGQRKVAGLVRARCSCCSQRQTLAPHRDLDATRLICPETGKTYLDRGDGVFEADGRQQEIDGVVFTLPGSTDSTPSPEAPARDSSDGGAGSTVARVRGQAVQAQSSATDMLSDRPRRTGPKTRIELERATFATAMACKGGK